MLIERVAQVDQRKPIGFCAEAVRRTVAEHQTLILPSVTTTASLEAPVNLPEANDRLRRAFAEHRRRVKP